MCRDNDGVFSTPRIGLLPSRFSVSTTSNIPQEKVSATKNLLTAGCVVQLQASVDKQCAKSECVVLHRTLWSNDDRHKYSVRSVSGSAPCLVSFRSTCQHTCGRASGDDASLWEVVTSPRKNTIRLRVLGTTVDVSSTICAMPSKRDFMYLSYLEKGGIAELLSHRRRQQ